MVNQSITLPIGKTVEPSYDAEHFLQYINVSPNMCASLFENNVVDKKSILEINEIILVTMYRKRTAIPVAQVKLIADGSYRFYVQKETKINRGQIVRPRYRR